MDEDLAERLLSLDRQLRDVEAEIARLTRPHQPILLGHRNFGLNPPTPRKWQEITAQHRNEPYNRSFVGEFPRDILSNGAVSLEYSRDARQCLDESQPEAMVAPDPSVLGIMEFVVYDTNGKLVTMYVELNRGAFPVWIQVDGGASGDAANPSTWTYSAYEMRGGYSPSHSASGATRGFGPVLGTGLTPLKGRSIGLAGNSLGHRVGTGFFASIPAGEPRRFHLFDAYEIYAATDDCNA